MLTDHDPFTDHALLGLTDTHVETLTEALSLGEVRLAPEVNEAFTELHHEAARFGFDLRAVSGFRSFSRQLRIWNEKADGLRPVLDLNESPIDLTTLSPTEQLVAILLWSALPGLSRHHWGTDIDVVDVAIMEDARRISLVTSEWSSGGPCHDLGRWLAERERSGEMFGFFRPYDGRRCAVAPEPWHLSYAPLAEQLQSRLLLVDVRALLRDKNVRLWPMIEVQLAGIIDDYARVKSLPKDGEVA